MDQPTINLQALIQETQALNCDDPFPLESAPLPFDNSFRLLGRLVSPNPPSLVWVRDILNVSWRFALPFEVDLLPGDRFLFKVFEHRLIKEIMDNGPYNVKGALLVVKPWPPELAFEEVDLSSCAFWVQVHGLPLENMLAVNAIKIGKLFGLEVLTVEDGERSGIINHHHLRFRLVIDVSLPLVPGFYLPRSGLSALWIKLLYERLGDYCVLCGCIGHRKTYCAAPPHLVDPERYTTSLRGYVYPKSRKLVSASPASVSSGSSIPPLPSSAGASGSVLYLQGAASASAAPPTIPSSTVPLRRVTDVPLPPVSRLHPSARSSYFYGQGAATYAQLYQSSKGKEKISPPLVTSDPMVVGQSDPQFGLGPVSSGPTVYGPHDQHNTGHIQLAQQITGVLSQSSLGLTVFGPSALHFYSGLPPATTDLMLFGSPLPVPISSQHQVRSLPPSFPFHVPPYMPVYPQNSLPDISHLYTQPIVTLPPPPFQVHSSPPSYNSPPVYSPTKPLPTKTSPSPRQSARHHPYLPKTQVSVVRGRAPVAEVYPTPLSELCPMLGQKRVAVSEVSDLFFPPSKKQSSSLGIRDRMLLAAQSLSSLRNSPPAPVTPGTTQELSLAASSPGSKDPLLAASLELLSSSAGKQFHKAARKTRSVTQLVLVDEVSHVDAHVAVSSSASFEAAGSARPPPAP